MSKARKPPRHALGGFQHIDKRRGLAIEGRLIKPRECQYLVDQRAHRLRLVVDEPRELLAVSGIYHVVPHELGIPRDYLKRRLHLVAHVAREIAAHRLSAREILVLLAKLSLLVVDSLEQRVHFLVNLVLERVGKVKRINRLHNARRQPLRQQEHEHNRHEKRERNRPHHAAEERDQGLARLGQAHNIPVLKLHRGIQRHGAKRARVAGHLPAPTLVGFAHLGTVGVVFHRRSIGHAVVEHRAVRVDKRIAEGIGKLLRKGLLARLRVEVAQRCRDVLRRRGQVALRIALVGDIENRRHSGAEDEQDNQREGEHAAEDAVRQAFHVVMGRTHDAPFIVYPTPRTVRMSSSAPDDAALSFCLSV